MIDLNRSLFDALFELSHRSLVLDGIGIFVAKYGLWFVVCAAAILIARTAGRRTRLFSFCETALALILSRGLVTEIIRFFYRHPRPFEVTGMEPIITSSSASSFPSGHAAILFAIAVSVIYFNRRWGFGFLFVAVLVGIARVFAGVHWPLDIAGGAAVGILSAVAVHAFLAPHRNALQRTEEPE